MGYLHRKRVWSLFARLLVDAPDGAARATTVTIPLFCTGLLGSYTTFSTFVVEIVRLGDGRPLVAILYAISSVALGLVSAYAGSRLAERRP